MFVWMSRGLSARSHGAHDPSARRQRDDSGASAVEFALVAPLLLTLVFGIITFGFLFGQDLALGNAARQTARYGAVENRTCADIKAEALSAAAPLADLSATGSVVQVTRGVTGGAKTNVCAADTDLPCKGSAPKDNVYVTLRYVANVLVPIIPGVGSTVELNSEGVFRCEWF
jgi:Flp pilus assembly protein TadG